MTSSHLSPRALAETRLISLVSALRREGYGSSWAPLRYAQDYLETGEQPFEGATAESLGACLAERARSELSGLMGHRLLQAVAACEARASEGVAS